MGFGDEARDRGRGLVAAEEGVVDLDEPAGPAGSTVRHLLAHASGLPLQGEVPVARPGTTRIYSNSGFEALAEHVAGHAEMPFAAYFEEVWGFPLDGSPARGVDAPISRLVEVGRELLEPARIGRETLAEACSVQFPGLGGVLPGFGRMEPNDWGLGFELRDAKPATGPAGATRPPRSAISAAAARFSGSIRQRASPSAA